MTINEVYTAVNAEDVKLSIDDVAFFCSVVDGELKRTLTNDETPVIYSPTDDLDTVLMVYAPFTNIYLAYCNSQYFLRVRQYSDYQNYADLYNNTYGEFSADYRITEITPDDTGTMSRVQSDLLSRRNVRVRAEDIAEWCTFIDSDLAMETGISKRKPYSASSDMDTQLIASGAYREMYFHYCSAMQCQDVGNTPQYESEYALYAQYRNKYIEDYRSNADTSIDDDVTPSLIESLVQARRPMFRTNVIDIALWCTAVDRELFNRTLKFVDPLVEVSADSSLSLSGADVELYVAYCTAMMYLYSGDSSAYSAEMARYDNIKYDYLLRFTRQLDLVEEEY